MLRLLKKPLKRLILQTPADAWLKSGVNVTASGGLEVARFVYAILSFRPEWRNLLLFRGKQWKMSRLRSTWQVW